MSNDRIVAFLNAASGEQLELSEGSVYRFWIDLVELWYMIMKQRYIILGQLMESVMFISYASFAKTRKKQNTNGHLKW